MLSLPQSRLWLLQKKLVSYLINSKSEPYVQMSTPPEFLNMLLDDISVDIDLFSVSTMAPEDSVTVPVGSMPSIPDSDVFGNNTQIGRCYYTLFPPEQDQKYLLPETYFPDTSIIKNWVCQFELTPSTNHLHVQGYVEFHKSALRFNTIVAYFKSKLPEGSSVRLSKPKFRWSKQSQACCANYCSKPDTRVPDSEPFFWPHNKDPLAFNQTLYDERLGKQKATGGGEEERAKIMDHIDSKPMYWTWDAVVHESRESSLLLAHVGWAKAYHQGRGAAAEPRKIVDVIILYGAGGTGKTTMAQDWGAVEGENIQERYYKRNFEDGRFWGGGITAYRGERVIHFDEFQGQMPAGEFKIVCDPGKPGLLTKVAIKGTGTRLNHETVVITSNSHPASWYHGMCSKDPKQWEPLARRFTKVLFFPENRPDGTPNRPTSVEEYHFKDQTADFKEFVRDYDKSVEHASTCWPLPDYSQDQMREGEMCSSSFQPAKRARY